MYKDMRFGGTNGQIKLIIIMFSRTKRKTKCNALILPNVWQ